MADEIIGALRVVLGLDTAAFSTGAKEAQATLDRLSSTFKTAIAGLAVGAIGAQIAASIKGVIDQAAELGKISEKFGIPVESLSALKYVAEQSEVSFDSLTKGFQKLSKAMLDAADPSSKAAKSFQAIGLNASDLRKLKPEDQLGVIADKFSTLAAGTDKAGISQRLFGKGGAELIPVLNLGSEGIQRLTDRAKELGIIISGQTADDARQFNRTLNDIHASSTAFWQQVTAALLPALQLLANYFVDAQKQGGLLKELIPNLITDYDITQVQRFGVSWENLGRIWGAVKQVGLAKTFTEFKTAADGVTDAVNKNREALENFDRAAANVNAGTFKGFLDKINEGIRAGEQYAASMTHVNTAVLAGKNAFDSFIESQKKSLEGQKAQAAASGQVVGTFEAMKVSMEGYEIATRNGGVMTDAMRLKLKALSDEAGATAVKVKGAQLTQEFLSPWDLYLQKVRDLNAEFDSGAIKQDTFGKAGKKAASDLITQYTQAASTTAGAFADLFTALGGANAKYFQVAKAFSIAQAIINVLEGVTKAYAQGGALGLITGAGVLATGMATVAKIIATQPPKAAAMGGKFQVGGAGGTDTQMVPIMMTPGEQVHVDQNKYGESSGSNRTITLQGLKPKEYYRGDVLRDFVDNLNQAIGDGLKIKLA